MVYSYKEGNRRIAIIFLECENILNKQIKIGRDSRKDKKLKNLLPKYWEYVRVQIGIKQENSVHLLFRRATTIYKILHLDIWKRSQHLWHSSTRLKANQKAKSKNDFHLIISMEWNNSKPRIETPPGASIRLFITIRKD